MARLRMDALRDIQLLEVTEGALVLAENLIKKGALPEKAMEDALHISVATVNGIDYLITWNCKHIANAKIRDKIGQICRSIGYEPPIICTPEELMEE